MMNQGKRHKRKRTEHRFGRVMESVPNPGKPRFSTISIALPGSVLDNCQTKELKTHLVGQIARAATIYHVDEITVFDDKLGKHTEACAMMARLLQYCECPQYLRRHFFPMHRDLQFAGLLAPVDAPHHVRAETRSKFREGVVLDDTGPNGNSLVNCGIRHKPIEIDTRVTAGIRCTVALEPSVYTSSQAIGKVVAPSAPRETDGTYWGYQTRLASSLKAALEEGHWSYDLKIGTSERGHQNIDARNYALPAYQHALIVFGGVAGIEECVDADESLKLAGSNSHVLFDQWYVNDADMGLCHRILPHGWPRVNICPLQGSRTIRTEEAVLIGLAKFNPLLRAAQGTKRTEKLVVSKVEFTDSSPSSEESD